jgi:dihydrofolate reductase
MNHVIAIAAVAGNGTIGRDGGLPWAPIQGDMARFRSLTMGYPVVMGSGTFRSLPRPLSHRTNIVISQNMPRGRTDGVIVARTLPYALHVAAELSPITWVIGGGQIYRAAWPYLTQLEITQVHGSYDGDVDFPEISNDEWNETSWTPHDGYSFASFLRRPPVHDTIRS